MSELAEKADRLLAQAAQLHRGGQSGRAAELYREVIHLQPRRAMAHLLLGRTQEDAGAFEAACAAYHTAFEANPRLEHANRDAGTPPWLKNATRDALRCLRRKYTSLHARVLEAARENWANADLSRVAQCMAIQHGRQKAEFADELQRPGSMYVPGIPPRPWFERSEFDWVPAFEAAFPEVKEELMGLLALDEASIARPYVNTEAAAPDSLRHLAGAYDWHAVHLYQGGRKQEANCLCCPATTAAVERLPLARMSGNAPEVFFSFLKPGTHIKPHFGVANSKTAVHLALVVPGDCAIRVGRESRTWAEGECLIFDDSFEHEAWNRGESLRVVLILEVWNPDLSEAERDTLFKLSRAIEDWAETIAISNETD